MGQTNGATKAEITLPALSVSDAELEVWRLAPIAKSAATVREATLRIVAAAVTAAAEEEANLVSRGLAPGVGSLSSVTLTREETSLVVCKGPALEALLAAIQKERATGYQDQDVVVEREWRLIKVEGPLPFGMVGVLHSILSPLKANHISVFAISTYDTDYLLVKQNLLDRAISALRGAGYSFQTTRKK